ncbi:MAG: helix-turn-helix domain-containing protein [Treponemataceae bacterium]
MLDSLYEFFRGSAGFSLIVGGLSLQFAPKRDGIRKSLGLLFSAIGFLFCLSALDPIFHLPTDPSNFLIIVAILTLSQSLYKITLYLFGDERKLRDVRKVLLFGVAWSCFVFLISLFDYVLGWESIRQSIEDQASLGPLHLAASIAIYIWPIAISVIAAKTVHASIHDVPMRASGTKVLVRGAIALVLILCAILLGAVLDSIVLYRVGHSALEFLTLAWFLFVSAKPDLFSIVRREIRDSYEKHLLLSDDEARLIGERIAMVTNDAAILGRSALDLRSLAAIIKVPPYRLSIYFNNRLNTSFPTWLNALRIKCVQRKILEEPGRAIFDIALEAGYNSKSSFNTHFSRIVGMSPSEYRRSITDKKSDFVKPNEILNVP